MLDKYQHSDLEQIKSSSFLEQMSSIGICKAMLKLNLEFNVLIALGGSHIGSWQKELDLPLKHVKIDYVVKKVPNMSL